MRKWLKGCILFFVAGMIGLGWLVWSDPLDASHFVMSEDAIFFWEYYERKHRLCQINADGSECRELYRGSDVPCRNLAYQDGWLFFLRSIKII